MAVHLATSSDYLKRTTALLPASGDSTVCYWVRYDTVPVAPNTQTSYVILDSPGVYTDYLGVFARTTFHRLSDSAAVISAAAPTAAVYYHVVWTQTGTTQRFYVNGALIGSHTLNRAAFTPGFELLGNDTFSTGDLDIAYCREWTAALTQAQILDEMQALTAVHTANL